MLGPVDFKKDMSFWKLDKYNGFFPIRWHIIKDVPNRLFRHITLQNNENKCVTFSRDTQEVILTLDGANVIPLIWGPLKMVVAYANEKIVQILSFEPP